MTASRRRWFRFSLRTFFVLLTVFGVWLGVQVKVMQTRKRALDSVLRQGGSVLFYDDIKQGTWMVPSPDDYYEPDAAASIRRVLGDKQVVVVSYHHDMDTNELLRMRALFPEAAIAPDSVPSQQPKRLK